MIEGKRVFWLFRSGCLNFWRGWYCNLEQKNHGVVEKPSRYVQYLDQRRQWIHLSIGMNEHLEDKYLLLLDEIVLTVTSLYLGSIRYQSPSSQLNFESSAILTDSYRLHFVPSFYQTQVLLGAI